MENMDAPSGQQAEVQTPQPAPPPLDHGAVNPDFGVFRNELNSFNDGLSYNFGEQKRISCQWLISRIEKGWKGVDIGGTEYLCAELAAKGVDITFYDQIAPRDFPVEKSIRADMHMLSQKVVPRSLDFITMRHTMEHSDNPMFQLWQCNRVLKDDGLLMLILPMNSPAWTAFPSHYSTLSYHHWLVLFYRAGFNVVEGDAGTWNSARPEFIEWRWVLRVKSRKMRLADRDEKIFNTRKV